MNRGLGMSLQIEIWFAAVECARSGKKATAGEVARRCGGVVTYHVAKRELTTLLNVGLLDKIDYQHRPAGERRGAIIAHHYVLARYPSAHQMYEAAAAHWNDIYPYYSIAKAG